MNNQNPHKYQMQFMPIGMCIGLALGSIFSRPIWGNVGTGMCMGLAIGMCIGMAIGAAKDKAEADKIAKQNIEIIPANKVPAIRCSICTGEQVAGFKDLETGSFEDIMLIKNDQDLAEFKTKYGIQGEIEKIY